MPPALRPWFRLLRASFAAQTRYLPAVAGGLIANTTFGFLKAAMLVATVHAAGGSVAGYDLESMVAYVWLSQGLLGAVQLNGTSEIGERVRTGEVAIDFARPLDIQTSYLAADLGRNLFNLSTRLLPPLVIGALTTGLRLPTSAGPYLLGAIAVLLGMTVSFFGRYAVNVIGFWLVEGRGLRNFYMIVSTFLAGLFVPVGMFPGWLHTLANCTPFPSILMTPIDVLSGRIVGAEAVRAVAVQVFWLAVTCAIGRLLTARGWLKLEVQGG
ncbi:ABC transporter permease [Nakamurella lactea]|uniref:ABC transporter permease n=1 Tax=Nakamurella lactea TaxID=459515 RepID=UPI00048C2E03|nr:ABC-2 family transporter protein [Nakamurella lactea]